MPGDDPVELIVKRCRAGGDRLPSDPRAEAIAGGATSENMRPVRGHYHRRKRFGQTPHSERPRARPLHGPRRLAEGIRQLTLQIEVGRETRDRYHERRTVVRVLADSYERSYERRGPAHDGAARPSMWELTAPSR